MKPSIYRDVWRILWPSALPLYISCLTPYGIPAFIASGIGGLVQGLLSGDGEFMRENLLLITLALLAGVIVMPVLTLIVNVLIFRRNLQHDHYAASCFFRKSYASIRRADIGVLTQRLTADPMHFRNVAAILPVRILADMTILVMILILMARQSIPITLSALALSAIGSALSALAAARTRKKLEEQKLYAEELSARQNMLLGNRLFLKLSMLSAPYGAHIRHGFARYYKATFKGLAHIQSFMDMLGQLTSTAGLFVILLLGIVLAQGDVAALGSLVTLYALFTVYLGAVNAIIGNLKKLPQIKDAARRMRELVQVEPETGGEDVPKSIDMRADGLTCSIDGRAVFSNVCFAASKGDTLWIRGENGTGKTTLLEILAGLLPCDDGEIRVGGLPLDTIARSAWHRQVAYVEQFPAIFPCTVLENIRLGDLSASEDALRRIAKRVGLSAIADRMIHDAAELSGGERKRVALARALLRNAPVLLMDEPYENTDTAGSELIDALLAKGDRLVIMVSHTPIRVNEQTVQIFLGEEEPVVND